MSDPNPYQPTQQIEHNLESVAERTSAIRWALIGFACGASLPMAYGMYGMFHHYHYIASLAPGEAACGMSALGSFAMIFVVGPICGMVGALVGQMSYWALALFRES